mmetsp:Transcript_8508/g.14610  ORF Transcript_8508/g.14610 Transcript_8508/m.14610 type:complete len:244 (+) Transcript_8508:396-1127(+)
MCDNSPAWCPEGIRSSFTLVTASPTSCKKASSFTVARSSFRMCVKDASVPSLLLLEGFSGDGGAEPALLPAEARGPAESPAVSRSEAYRLGRELAVLHALPLFEARSRKSEPLSRLAAEEVVDELPHRSPFGELRGIVLQSSEARSRTSSNVIGPVDFCVTTFLSSHPAARRSRTSLSKQRMRCGTFSDVESFVNLSNTSLSALWCGQSILLSKFGPMTVRKAARLSRYSGCSYGSDINSFVT